MYVLKNNYLEVNAKSHGAEITRVLGKKDNTDFLWNGDKNYWGYHSPVLFPIVGKVKNNLYKIDGLNYTLNQHGLARLENFSLKEQTTDKLVFQLDYNEETLKVYPYKFSLKITHILEENKVTTKYEVENKDDKDIYFGIGAHPAFMCPIEKNEKFEDFYFEFDKAETAKILKVNKDGLFTRDLENYLENESKINLNFDIFKDDALVFENLKSNCISLKSQKSKKHIKFDFSEFPVLGLWTKEDYPFICIEPWFSHADYEDFEGDFKEKEGIIKLAKNDIFKCKYSVVYFE